MLLCVFLTQQIKYWLQQLKGLQKCKSNHERVTQKLLEILNENEQEGLVGLVRRFMPVTNKTIAQVMEDLTALEEKYAAYRSDLIRIIQYSRGKAIFSERQIARQVETDLYYYVCYHLAQLQKWLEAEEKAEPGAGQVAACSQNSKDEIR